MLRLVLAGLAALIAGAVYFVRLTLAKRKELEGLPMPPIDKLFGHLPIAGDARKLFPPNTHVQNWFHWIKVKYGMGDFFYLDWWPLGPRWLFIADPELASRYCTTGQSLPKAVLQKPYLTTLLGPQNMVTLEGSEWKALRSMFNPGFSASHLFTLVPYIVDSTTVFVDLLKQKAQSGELFGLEAMTTRLTIDIIGKVALDLDFNSQRRPHPLVDTFRNQVNMMPNASSVGPLDDINLVRTVRLWWNGRKLNRLVGEELDKRIALRQASQTPNGTGTANASPSGRKRSIVDLALDAYEKETRQSSGKDAPAPNFSAFRVNAIDSLKTFIFAGHDTTSAVLCYTLYLLHLHPAVQKKVIAELDAVFGPDCTSASIADSVRAEPHIISRLEYLNAVIKETLRVFPPVSTLRQCFTPTDGKDVTFTDPKTGNTYPLLGFSIWPVALLIHRHEDYFPQPTHFIPERFLPAETPFPDAKLFTPAGKDAWRPFEKGPRNCIGQELAMIESRIVLAMTCKAFDFTAEYYGEEIHSWTPVQTAVEFADGVPGSERMRIEGHRPYQVLNGAASPRDGMPGRIKLRT